MTTLDGLLNGIDLTLFCAKKESSQFRPRPTQDKGAVVLDAVVEGCNMAWFERCCGWHFVR